MKRQCSSFNGFTRWYKRQHCSQKMRVEEGGLGMGHKAESTAHVGNKVLPISDATPTSESTLTNKECGPSDKKDKRKGDRTKTLSRMKELLKWAAAAKSEKGRKYISRKVMQFRNRGTVKEMAHDDQWISSSPKISFKWDSESCSTTTSVYSAVSLPSALRNDKKWTTPFSEKAADDGLPSNSNECSSVRGNWITTDDEFVVLEL